MGQCCHFAHNPHYQTTCASITDLLLPTSACRPRSLAACSWKGLSVNCTTWTAVHSHSLGCSNPRPPFYAPQRLTRVRRDAAHGANARRSAQTSNFGIARSDCIRFDVIKGEREDIERLIAAIRRDDINSMLLRNDLCVDLIGPRQFFFASCGPRWEHEIMSFGLVLLVSC